MNREELDKMNAEIEEVRVIKLEAMERAMRSRGFSRWLNLRLARFFGWAQRLGEKIREDEIRRD